MQATTIVIDGCNYGVADIQLPKIGPDGGPTGELIDAKQLTFVVQEGTPSVTAVHVRWLPEQWEDFKRKIDEKHVVPASPADIAALARGNGSV